MATGATGEAGDAGEAVLKMGCWSEVERVTGDGAHWQAKLLAADGSRFEVWLDGALVGATIDFNLTAAGSSGGEDVAAIEVGGIVSGARGLLGRDLDLIAGGGEPQPLVHQDLVGGGFS